MSKFDPLRFIADHAGMALADAISEACRQGQQDAQPVPDTNDRDTISRQAVIEIVDFECGEWKGLAKTIAERLSDLPPAQPEIIRCKDCKWYGFYSCELHGNDWMRDGNGFCDRAERREE